MPSSRGYTFETPFQTCSALCATVPSSAVASTNAWTKPKGKTVFQNLSCEEKTQAGKYDEFCGPYPKKIGATYKGQMVKPGRLGSATTYAYVSTKPRPLELFVRGRGFGWHADKEDEEQGPHEEPVFKTSKAKPTMRSQDAESKKSPGFRSGATPATPTQTHKEFPSIWSLTNSATADRLAEGSLSDEDALTETSEVNSDTDNYRKGHGLHHSLLSTNISISEELGTGFRKEAIQRRLKLLEADRDDRDRERDGKKERVLEKVKLLESIREGDKGVEMKRSFSDEDGVAAERIRSCSTCEDFLDQLECSKPENQRKSLGQFKLKDLEELEMARKRLESDLGINVKRSSSDSVNYEATHGLQRSKMGLNLSIINLGEDFKRERILEKLKLLEANREEDGSAISRVVKIRFSGDNGDIDVTEEANNQADEADMRLRSCSTCRDSLDALECTKPENRRKSLAHWTAKGLDVIEMTMKQLESELSNETRASYNDTVVTRSRSNSSPTDLDRGRSNSHRNSHRNSTPSDTEASSSFDHSLHQSKVMLNLSVMDLGADFKKERILEKLKLLEAKRRSSSFSGERTPKIKFYEGDAEVNDSPNSCSTCEGSLDALDCSKPNKQRKSLAHWRNKSLEAIELAVMELESSGKSTLGFSANRTPFGSDSEGVARDGSFHSSEASNSLHMSGVSMNLSGRVNLEEFEETEEVFEKKERILKMLEVLEMNRKEASEHGLPNASADEKGTNASITNANSTNANSSTNTIGSCCTCKNSIERLDCSKIYNRRKMIQKWRKKDKQEFESARNQLLNENHKKRLKAMEQNAPSASGGEAYIVGGRRQSNRGLASSRHYGPGGWGFDILGSCSTCNSPEQESVLSLYNGQ